MSLSVVLPVKEDANLRAVGLARITRQLALAEESLGVVELIVVDHARHDESADALGEYLSGFAAGRLVQLPWACGMGTALKAGVAAATSEIVVFADLDYQTEFNYLTTVVELLEDADLVLTSQPALVANRTNANTAARLTKSAYECLAHRLGASTFAGGRHHLAALRAEVAKPLFALLHSPELAFDVETRVVAASMGLRIVELPPSPVTHGHSAEAEPRLGHPARLGSMAADLLRARAHRARALKAGALRPAVIAVPDPMSVGVRPSIIDLTDARIADRPVASSRPRIEPRRAEV